MRLFFALLLAALLLPVASGEDHTVLVSQSADGSSYYFEPVVLNYMISTFPIAWNARIRSTSAPLVPLLLPCSSGL